MRWTWDPFVQFLVNMNVFYNMNLNAVNVIIMIIIIIELGLPAA